MTEKITGKRPPRSPIDDLELQYWKDQDAYSTFENISNAIKNSSLEDRLINTGTIIAFGTGNKI